jgi:methylmalonyl-CoA/ethylmalonyl-CoA epimerase
MTTTALATGVCQIAVPCEDVSRATAFYRDGVGLPFLFESGGLAFLMCGDVRFMLAKPEPNDPVHTISCVYFSTDDIEGAAKAIATRGAKMEGEPHIVGRLPGKDVWLAHFRDTEGNLMAFMQEKPTG